jgi:hypothetical protein
LAASAHLLGQYRLRKPQIHQPSREHIPLPGRQQTLDADCRQSSKVTKVIRDSADDESRNSYSSALVADNTTHMPKDSDSEHVSFNTTAPQSTEMSVSDRSSRLPFTSDLQSNPNTEQSLCASMNQDSSLDPASELPSCCTQPGRSWSKLSLERRGELFPCDSAKEYYIREIPISRIAQPIRRSPPTMTWPKHRSDRYWEWDVSKLRGTCICTEQLMLERTRVSWRAYKRFPKETNRNSIFLYGLPLNSLNMREVRSRPDVEK